MAAALQLHCTFNSIASNKVQGDLSIVIAEFNKSFGAKVSVTNNKADIENQEKNSQSVAFESVEQL